MYMRGRLSVERRRQLDGRSAAAYKFTQISRSNMSAGKKFDRRDIGADRIEVIACRSFGQRSRAVGVHNNGRDTELGRPPAVRATIDHRAIVKTIGGDHNR